MTIVYTDLTCISDSHPGVHEQWCVNAARLRIIGIFCFVSQFLKNKKGRHDMLKQNITALLFIYSWITVLDSEWTGVDKSRSNEHHVTTLIRYQRVQLHVVLF